MAWKKRTWSYRNSEYCAYRIKQDAIAERGTGYQRNPEHQKKDLTEAEQQKREWKQQQSQYRDQKRYWGSWKRFCKHYCARYYRAWVRTNIAQNNWDAFLGDGLEYRRQENPWSWD